MGVTPILVLLVGGTLSLTLGGCKECDSCGAHHPQYLPQTSEDNVLHNFVEAWRYREVDQYTKLLASDFQFLDDSATREQLGIEFWTKTSESAAVGCLFESPDVTKITIDLSWPWRSATNTGFLPPREGWTKIIVSDVFLDVDFMPPGQDLTTFRIEDQVQRFFFRRGRTYPPSGPGDTLVYIVEWHDEGTPSSKPGTATAVEPTTWSKIKLLGDCPSHVSEITAGE